MAQEAVFTVLQRAGTIAVDEAINLLAIPDKLESAKKQLARMQGFLKDMDDTMVKDGSMSTSLISQVKGIAYEVEDIIDTANIWTRQSDPKTSIMGAISKYACFPVYLTRLHQLGARIDSANAELTRLLTDFKYLSFAVTAVAEKPWHYFTEDDTIQQLRFVHPDFDEKTDVIGFNDEIKQIKDELLDTRNRHLTVVSIFGPGGAGKSTVVKKVYGLDEVKGHFEVRSWITVSQRFVPRLLLNEMVKATIGVQQAEDLDKKTDHEVMKLLHDFLQSKRYLIVLDDVWSTTAWDKFGAIFPDEGRGSRVIMTTRNQAVARHPGVRKTPRELKPLNDKESTRLLLSKALAKYKSVDSSRSSLSVSAKRELEELGRHLAAKCCGLPLAIVVLGVHLSKNNLDIAQWKRLANTNTVNNMQASITTESVRVIDGVLDLSYYDMPSHLRSCFMYTTAFPAESSIDVRVLASLWAAEGFIPQVRDHSREEVAAKYIDELVQRCMIQVETRTAMTGRVTAIKMSDILRQCALVRARKEGFIKDCRDLNDVEASYSQEAVEAFRVVLHGFLAKEVAAYMRHLRTVLAFGFSGVKVGKSIIQGLHRHLRVFYLHSSEMEVFLPREIGRMRYLRYLGFGGTCTYHLPSSIGNLLSLETLDATGGRIHVVPVSLWKIPTLKSVRISRAGGWTVPQISPQSKVHAMVLSSTADVHCPSPDQDTTSAVLECTRILEATKQQLSKDNNDPNFSCCFGMTYHTKSTGNQMSIVGRCKRGLQFTNSDLLDFEEMDCITVLKIHCANLLSTDQNILELGSMKFLRVLEIGEGSYTGSIMTCPSGSFQCLGRLVLYDLAMVGWKMEDDSMARLKELTVCRCTCLRYLPEGLLSLTGLNKLELIEMPRYYQRDTVVLELKDKGCAVLFSSNEEAFQQLHLPIPTLNMVGP